MEQIINNSDNRPSVVAVGNFDGVHKGHQLVFSHTLKIAATENLYSVALTFSPHPRNFFNTACPVKMITDDDYKRELILSLGIEKVFFQKFDKEFASLDSEAFVLYLKNTFSCKAIVCGENFRFGKGAAYRTDDLSAVCEKYGMKLHVVPVDPYVNSSAVRAFLEQGNPSAAAELLGRPYSISSSVFYGKQLGTKIGFPTMNQKLFEGSVVPKFGVYAGFVEIDGKQFKCIVNIGYRPTVNSDISDVDAETHIFDFSGDLYGKTVRVYIVEFIREERKFKNPIELSEQIKSDCRFVTESDFCNLKSMQNQQ